MSGSGLAWAATACCMVASYLVCGIPFGLIWGKVVGGVDIRTAGSGNIGSTNALRVGGKTVGALTLVCDVLKGVISLEASKYAIALVGFGQSVAVTDPGAAGDVMVAAVSLACICGHVFSPYLHFHGGKGVAAGLGVLLGLSPVLGLLHLGIFLVAVVPTRYVSLGSVVTALAAPITVRLLFPQCSLGYWLIVTAMALIVVWAHRGNIKRLLAGTESKLSFGKNQSSGSGTNG